MASEFRFIRRRGKIIPIRIRKRREDVLKALGVGAVGAGALEASRRKTILNAENFKIVKRESIFSKRITLTSKTKGLFGFMVGQASIVKKGNVGTVDLLFGAPGRTKLNSALLRQIVKQSRAKNISSLTGTLVNPGLVSPLAKRGASFESLSLSRGRRKVSGRAAKGLITKSLKVIKSGRKGKITAIQVLLKLK